VNVDLQRRDPGSLVNWFQAAVRARRELLDFGNAAWETVRSKDEAVLALRFRSQEREVLALHNLSDRPTKTGVDGSGFADVFADCRYDGTGRSLELTGLGYRWLVADSP
jgi:maltose alpha-D-glucosyltransferase / alpha-amylase